MKLDQGATVGILGGGQLGRMLAVAAARLGFKTHIFEPSLNPPAAQTANFVTTAQYDDAQALENFAKNVDVITYEFENVPTSALDLLEKLKPIRPGREALRVSQDRLFEKQFLTSLGLSVAPFANVESVNDLTVALETVKMPSILKTRRFGYDGKGQIRLTKTEDIQGATEMASSAPSVLEGFVDFSQEVSVIAARGINGELCCYDPGENQHRNGILDKTTVPAKLSASQRSDAVLLAAKILNELDYVGVMGVELFVTNQGLVVNEIAPRVHNSGHWTQQGCAIDQFEQHIRAVAGWPLGDGSRYADVVMENLIGTDIDKVESISQEPNASVHLYGKDTVKPGRKMGHVNRVFSRS